MKATQMTLEQIRITGITALLRELGPVGMIRFLQQYEIGRGDYTAERRALLGDQDVTALLGRIRQSRKKKNH